MSERKRDRVDLAPVSQDGLRFYIRLNGEYAGGITVHSLCGETFSYGIAVAPVVRRRGAAQEGLGRLFTLMRARGFTRCVVQVEEDNAPSLALHEKLGFVRTGQKGCIVTMEKSL